jgi:ethanolamine utilization protein EutN
MQLGLVVGTATATARHPSMRGWKLLVVQPLMADNRRPDGDPQLAIDNLGAGVGQSVIISSDGAGTRALLGTDATPVRWSVIGIPDGEG